MPTGPGLDSKTPSHCHRTAFSELRGPFEFAGVPVPHLPLSNSDPARSPGSLWYTHPPPSRTGTVFHPTVGLLQNQGSIPDSVLLVSSSRPVVRLLPGVFVALSAAASVLLPDTIADHRFAHLPALPLQHHQNLPAAVSNSFSRDLPHPHSQLRLRILVAFVSIRSSM